MEIPQEFLPKKLGLAASILAAKEKERAEKKAEEERSAKAE